MSTPSSVSMDAIGIKSVINPVSYNMHLITSASKTISNLWESFIDKHKHVKPLVELKPSDYLVGLRGICAVFISKPEFSSQTKEKLVVAKNYFDDLMKDFSKKLYKWLEDNIDKAQQLIKRFEEYRLAQNALLSRKEISSLIKINDDNSDNIRRRSVVSKLVESISGMSKYVTTFSSSSFIKENILFCGINSSPSIISRAL